MVREKEVRQLIPDLNKVLGLKPPIPEDGELETITELVKEAIGWITPSDVFSAPAERIIEKLKQADYEIEQDPLPEKLEIPEPVEEVQGAEFETNKKFESAVPPLTADEYEKLKSLIQRDGKVLQPVLFWGKYIVDGHNRYKIAKELGLDYPSKAKNFKSEEEAILWIKENAVSQRNLTDFEKYELLKEIETGLKHTGKETKKRKGTKVEQPEEKHDTDAIIAKKIGISKSQVRKARVVSEEAPEEVKEEVRKGKKTISKAHEEVVKKKKVITVEPSPEMELLEKGAKSLERWIEVYANEKTLEEFIPAIQETVDMIREKSKRLGG